MHGNILDANSTNKLIDQSVKDAIDNSIENSNYVTKDLLEAETSARTKSDEDLNAKIKAEQTRAEGKEKQISDKLAIVDGDSNTEGSFRKAIADVIAAAPEDLDTLKEIADKLAGNDDLHTALNQAITEKADASALANEVSRATGVENDLRTAIGTKADATALSNYVLTTALNQQIDTLNAAISAKQDAGNYIPYDSSTNSEYRIGKNLYVAGNQNSSLVMDAIRGNANAITQLASNLNCDFNALNNAICCVRSGIQEVAGNVNFSAERVINAINLGDANLTSALQNCCCQTQQNIIKMGYENQLGQKDIVNQMQTGFSQTNSGLERAASNLGFQMSQIACDLKTNANANTQRIVDVLNNHWQSDLQQRYNDARLELSQQKQNATLIAALKTTAAA